MSHKFSPKESKKVKGGAESARVMVLFSSTRVSKTLIDSLYYQANTEMNMNMRCLRTWLISNVSKVYTDHKPTWGEQRNDNLSKDVLCEQYSHI